MPKSSLFDGIKKRFRSRSPAPRHTTADGPLTGAPQAPEPFINSTQDAEPSTSALQPAETLPPPALSDPSDIDREKYGLFRIATPIASSIAENTRLDTNSIDIVAVHGLNGTAYGTWTHERGNFWLADLAKDFPGARVFTYGYASEVCFTQGTGNIDTFSRSLLEALKRERKRKNDRTRPIIFICHSMGGIVVKKALVTAKIEDFLFDNIIKSVAAIAFLSTPHRGSSTTALPLILADVANFAFLGATRFLGTTRSDLIESLKRDSLSLKEVSTNFRGQTQNMSIASFTEQVITPPAKARIVDEISGAMDIARERIIPMHGCDHRSICRFPGRDSEGYKIVLAVLRDWVDDINEAENKVTTSEDLSCLQSLSFPEINYRRQEADQAYENTCAWILEHPVYTEWSAKNCELLWIQGNPGSGKSTLMSFIYDGFHKNIPRSREVVLDYFFHGRGSTLQKTRVGMFRTLLHQLYHQVHFIRPQTQAVFKEKERFGKAGTEWEWHPKECERLFSESIVYAAQSRNITLFVDALDEAHPDGSDLASYFHELNGKLRAGNCNARICISCRKYPVIAPNACLKIYVEKENGGDIKMYVEQKFDSEIQNHGMAMPGQEEFKKLQTAVVERSQNTFQWACLVVPLIIKLRRDGLPLAYIMKELDKVPQGLDEVYEHILTKVIEFQYRPKTLLLMQWVCLANAPLTVTDIRFAMMSDACIDERQQSWSNLEDFVESDEEMEILITSVSGGLVETISHEYNYYTELNSSPPVDYDSTVQFIHQSINDFLLSGGLRLLAQLPSPMAWGKRELSSSADSIIGQSHDRLCKSCINYIKLEEVLNEYANNYQKEGDIIPFFLYAQRYWVFHAERANSYKISQQHLIQRLGLYPHRSFFDTMSIYAVYPPKFQRDSHLMLSLLHIASIANLPSVVIEILRTDPCMVNYRNSQNKKPLHYAARYGHSVLVEMLLDAEGTTSADSAREVFITAVEGGHEQVVKLLLGRGADVRGNTEVAGNALITAVQSTSKENFRSLPWGDVERKGAVGGVSLIKLLLNLGADANAQGDNNRTAIEDAITSPVVHTGAVKLLLESGANANSRSAFTSILEFLNERFSASEGLLSDDNSLGGLPEPDGTVLQVAAALNDKDTAVTVTKLLLENGADASESSIHGTAIQIASARGNTSVVELLLKKGADIDGLMENSLTLLQEASERGDLPVVEFLLKKGASVNLQEHGSPSPLQFAASRWDTELVKLLLDNSANVNAPGGQYGTALQAVSQTSMRSVNNWLVLQALRNAISPKKHLLSFSAGSREVPGVETAKLLLDVGADITGPGRLLSEIWTASIGGNSGVVKLLIERGAGNTEFGETLGQVLEGLSKQYPQSEHDFNPDLYSLAGSFDIIFDKDSGNNVDDDDDGNARANEDIRSGSRIGDMRHQGIETMHKSSSQPDPSISIAQQPWQLLETAWSSSTRSPSLPTPARRLRSSSC